MGADLEADLAMLRLLHNSHNSTPVPVGASVAPEGARLGPGLWHCCCCQCYYFPWPSHPCPLNSSHQSFCQGFTGLGSAGGSSMQPETPRSAAAASAALHHWARRLRVPGIVQAMRRLRQEFCRGWSTAGAETGAGPAGCSRTVRSRTNCCWTRPASSART